MSTAPRAKRRAAFLEPLRNEKRSTGLKPKSIEHPSIDARRVSPKRRWCLACDPPREKTAAAFADHAADRCRKCVREGNPVQEPKPVSRKRLCIVCGDHRSPARFERHGGIMAETCDLCSTDPAIRVTLRQEDAASAALRALRQIAAARLDGVDGMPTLGCLALQEIAADALRRIEEAR